jgi:CBS domain containing-hemolysin-like protein
VSALYVPLHWLGIVIAFVCIALAAAAEASLTVISRRQLNALQHASRASMVQSLINDAYRFKVALFLLNTLALISITALTFDLIRDQPPLVELVTVSALALIVIIFGEALPKAIAVRNPAVTAQFIATPFWVAATLLQPLIMLIDYTARRIFAGTSRDELAPMVTEEELLTIVNVGEEEGIIEPNEREMIRDIITFGDTVVREIMIPRVDVVTINAAAALQDALTIITTYGHSRIPVIWESSDRIVGVLYAKDILASIRYGQSEVVIKDLMRSPYYVPEMVKIDILLKNMQSKRVHFAVIVDEYGATTGIVTLEDILEEIVGDINDEFDRATIPDVVWNGPGDVTVEARLLLDDVNDLTGLQLHSDSSDRVGGYVTEQLGRMSQINDVITQSNGIVLTVVAIDGIRTSRIRITYPATMGRHHDIHQS